MTEKTQNQTPEDKEKVGDSPPPGKQAEAQTKEGKTFQGDGTEKKG